MDRQYCHHMSHRTTYLFYFIPFFLTFIDYLSFFCISLFSSSSDSQSLFTPILPCIFSSSITFFHISTPTHFYFHTFSQFYTFIFTHFHIFILSFSHLTHFHTFTFSHMFKFSDIITPLHFHTFIVTFSHLHFHTVHVFFFIFSSLFHCLIYKGSYHLLPFFNISLSSLYHLSPFISPFAFILHFLTYI